MSNLRLDVDIDSLSSAFGELKNQVKKDLNDSVKALASMTHGKTLEIATEDLKSLAKMYKDGVTFQEIEENLWVVSLDEKLLWIEEGRKSGFMEELLRGKSAKTNKKGQKYAVIPFEHSKNPSEQSNTAQQLTEQIRTYLKKKDISYKKIEYNPDGSPRLGLLHRFSVKSARLKPIHKHEPLEGVAIYQRKDEQGKVQRDVMTFRVISEKHRAEGLWVHPGREGNKIMDKAFEWAVKTWENQILPEVLSKYENR